MASDTAEALEAAIIAGRWAEWTTFLRAIRIERAEITPRGNERKPRRSCQTGSDGASRPEKGQP